MSGRARLGLVALVFFLLGILLAPRLPQAWAQGTSKEPKWSHALTLGCRKYNEDDFTKETRRFGIEVFTDQANGNLIYISETGSISVVRGR